ncbi:MULTISPECIES: serine hydrolase domain-containing protein [Hyphobacterium]|uniref:Serine hydrolase domain-containing protein n=1 Tax=Hyphobacterium vulgare TaxID=1736751 RepID=A0ABV6ZWK6_9PROT
MSDKPAIHGTTAPGFEPVRDAFAANWQTGNEIGAAFALMIDGETVVDLWGGWADRKKTLPWTEDTIVPVFSTGKAVTAMVMAKLVSDGTIDYDAPVADYWPEFARAGKDRVTVAEALSHQAGLAGFPEPMEPGDWFDRDFIEDRLAAMHPLWVPGQGSGYHPLTHGFIADAIARRMTGRTIGGHLREDIAGPRCIDFRIGTPESEHSRTAEHVLPPRPPFLGKMNDIKAAAFLKPWSSPGRRGAAEWRMAEFPAANGHGTARAIAELLSPFARAGKLRDTQLIAPDVVEAAMRERVSGPDRVLPFDLAYGAGILINRDLGHLGPEPKAVGQYGFGGSCGFADPVRGISGSYVMNRQMDVLSGDPRAMALIEAAYGCL